MNISTSVRRIHDDELAELFPLPCTAIQTRGTQTGVVLRFKTFYLKVYDDEIEDSYVIQGWRYKAKTPVFIETVSFFRLREFASRFTKEDHLVSMQEPCESPQCPILGHQLMTKYPE